jgi:hypothetical protein
MFDFQTLNKMRQSKILVFFFEGRSDRHLRQKVNSQKFTLYTHLVKIENLLSRRVNLEFTLFTRRFCVITHEIPKKIKFLFTYTRKV